MMQLQQVGFNVPCKLCSLFGLHWQMYCTFHTYHNTIICINRTHTFVNAILILVSISIFSFKP
jgi:hypothetical protein